MYNEQENPGWRTSDEQEVQEAPESVSWQQPAPQYTPEVNHKRKSVWSAGKVIALALVCSLLGGVLGAGFLWLVTGDGITSPSESDKVIVQQGQREDVVIDLEQIDIGEEMTAAEVYAKNVNSTVGIKTSITTNYWGYQTTSAASGSGFILSENGYILTNYHVVEDSNSITVSCYDGTTYDAVLVGYDKSNDIAILKVDAKDLTPVVIGNSENLHVGDDVIAIGNPLGELTFSLTAGKVSAMERQITLQNGVSMQLIQTDCAINSGNSGGALFNLYGEVVGITNAKYSGNSGSGASIDNIGFAIPVNDVWDMIQSIIEKGYVAKPYIGISAINVSLETQSYGLPQGAAIQKIFENSPAEAAGLQVNDIITHVNGEAITDRSELLDKISDSKVGDIMKLTVYRMGQTIEVEVTIGETVENALPESQPHQQQQPIYDYPWFWFP